MPGVTVLPNETQTLLASASRAAATTNSEDFWIPGCTGIEVIVDVTVVGASASLDTLSIQARTNDSYDTIATFGSLAITAAGRHRFIVAPGATRAGGGGNDYKGKEEDIAPTNGRIQTIHSVQVMTFSISIRGIA